MTFRLSSRNGKSTLHRKAFLLLCWMTICGLIARSIVSGGLGTSLPLTRQIHSPVVVEANKSSTTAATTNDKSGGEKNDIIVGSKDDKNETKSNNSYDDKNNNNNNTDDNKIHIESYEDKFERLTMLDPDQPTLAFTNVRFGAGFCNIVMAFTSFLMWAHDNNFTQVLLPSLRWGDALGARHWIQHEQLFDVVHWNEYYASSLQPHTSDPVLSFGGRKPPLPRLVVHHPSMVHFNKDGEWLIGHQNATHPYAYGIQGRLFKEYRHYDSKVANSDQVRHPSDFAILQGALRPHPGLQRVIQDYKYSRKSSSDALSPPPSLSSSSASSSNHGRHMCLHARIEPDMQFHYLCKDKKVTSLEGIIDGIYKEFPTPPPSIQRILVVLNRPLLERKANPTKNELAFRNLALLNQLRSEGMWNGTVRVVEAGIPILPKETFFGKEAPGISGAILDFHLALESDIFIGTPVSSFSMYLMAARYHRNLTDNYMYLPSGLEKVNPTRQPPPFRC